MQFETVHNSHTPIDCHIIKGRLSSHGIRCFIYDENIVWVYPYKSVLIGGVKLKVPHDQAENAKKIMDCISRDKLIDKNEEYSISEVFQFEYDRQNEILKLKSQIRLDPDLILTPEKIKSEILNRQEIGSLVKEEIKFKELSEKKLNFKLKNFINEFFDPDSSAIQYLRIRPLEYYLDKDIVENYTNSKPNSSKSTCPYCNSENVRYDYAIDYHWDVLFLFLCIVTFVGMPPPLRKKFHCFDCGRNYRKKTASADTKLRDTN